MSAKLTDEQMSQVLDRLEDHIDCTFEWCQRDRQMFSDDCHCASALLQSEETVKELRLANDMRFELIMEHGRNLKDAEANSKHHFDQWKNYEAAYSKASEQLKEHEATIARMKETISSVHACGCAKYRAESALDQEGK